MSTFCYFSRVFKRFRFLQPRMAQLESSNAAQNHIFYKLRPINPLGAEVTEIDLCRVKMTQLLTEQIRKDTQKHNLLIFRKQGSETEDIIPPKKYVSLPKMFENVKKNVCSELPKTNLNNII